MAASTPPALRLFLLGQFAVEFEGRAIAARQWTRRRPVELLTALGLAPGHVLHREEIIDRLWPDKTLDSGANNLYRTLHTLRRTVGEGVVRVDRGAVRLPDQTWVDVAEFERAASSASIEQMLGAVDLYRGPLLPDDPYAEVLEARRVGLRQRFIDICLRLARAREHVGDDRRVEVLRRLLDVEPTLEEGHRTLMAILAEGGRTADACIQFNLCADALREKLSTVPSEETRALLERIKVGEVTPRNSSAAAENPTITVAMATQSRGDNWAHVADRLLGTDRPRPIRGRDALLAEIEAFAAADGGALAIVGEAGAGKTRMGVEVARACVRGGGIVIAGLGYEFEGAAPYTPFVDGWTDALRFAPGHDNPFSTFEPRPGASPQEDRLRLFRAVEESVRALAGAGTACVLIEDLHHADESSLQLFHHLARAARHLPLKLIGTVRREEIHPGNPLHVLLGGLGRERTTRKVLLERLDWEATRALIADVLGEAPSPAVVDTVHRLAGGNPFFTEEVAVSVREATGTDFAPPSDLMQTVLSRMSRLGPDIERFLVAAAVQGVRFGFEAAREVSGLEAEPALDALDRALSAHVLEELESQYRFRHALLREALYDSLSSARRIFLHRATAVALERRGAAVEPEVLAFHHHAAGNLEQALPHVIGAIGHAQSRLGFGEAVIHSERALELLDALGRPPDDQRFGTLRNMGAMRVALGDLDLAVRDLDAAAQMRRLSPPWTPTPVQRCSARRLAALALIEAGLLEEAEARLDLALEALGDVDDPGESCNIYYLYSQLRWHQSRHEDAFDLAKRCLAVAERADDEESIAKGYEMLALACHSLGQWKEGRDYEERRTRVADGQLDVASAFDVHL